MSGGHGDDGRHIVAVSRLIVAVTFGIEVNNVGCIHGNLFFGNPLLLEEVDDGRIRAVYLIVQSRQVVAQSLVHQRPCHFVGRHFHFGQSFYVHHSITVGKPVQPVFNKLAHQQQSACNDKGFPFPTFHKREFLGLFPLYIL